MNKDRRNSLNRIRTAIEALKGTIEFDELVEALTEARDDIEEQKDAEQEYFDNMPEGFQNGEKGERATEAIDYLETAHGILDELIDTFENIDLANKIEEIADNLENAANV
jgi:predicted nuclease with TOPRIM domain